MEHERPNPYVGPRPFHCSETIYGRKREAKELISLLIAERIVLFYSPSGAGKTSLIHTTLIPMLEQEDFTVFPVMRVSSGVAWSFQPETTNPTVMAPDKAVATERPVNSVAMMSRTRSRGSRTKSARSERSLNRYILSLLVSLEAAVPARQQLALDDLKHLTLSEYLDQRFRKRSDADGYDEATENDEEDEDEDEPEYQVLIFDQLEELLHIDPTNQEARKDFFEQVGAALTAPHRWAILVVREDYIATLRPYFRVIPTRMNNAYRLDLLIEARARKAIQEPALQHGVTFDDAALDQLINALRLMQVYDQLDGSMYEVQSHSIDPIQLQVVCYRLWQQLPAGQECIGVDAIASLGTVKHALIDYYSDCIRAVVHETGLDEQTLRSWVEETLITRHGMRRKVVQELEQSQGLDNRVIMHLVASNLVRMEQQGETTWFELAHERMIAPIRQSNAAWHETRLNLLRQYEKDDLLRRQATQRRYIYGLSITTVLVTLLAILFFLRSEHEHARAEAMVTQLALLQTTSEVLQETSIAPVITPQTAHTETVIALPRPEPALPSATRPSLAEPILPAAADSVPLPTSIPRPATGATAVPSAPAEPMTIAPITSTITATPRITITLEPASQQAPGAREID